MTDRSIPAAIRVSGARKVYTVFPNTKRIAVEDVVTVAALALAPSDAPVSCGIPGHDHPGQEVVTGDFRVDDPPLRWEVSGRCGFVGDFDYTS